MRASGALLAALTGVLLAACGPAADPEEPADPRPSLTVSATPTPDQPPAPPESPEGNAESEQVAEPERAILDWKDVGPITRPATIGADTTITLGSDLAELSISGESQELPAPRGFRPAEALVDDQWVVVVHQDTTETLPSSATVIERGNGRLTLIDGASEVPTVSGGTWALGPISAGGPTALFHATTGPQNAYCLAEVTLPGDVPGSARVRWCAPKGEGFNDARPTPAGLTVLSFTSSRPSCRTPLAIAADGTATPVPGPVECKGWDALLTPRGPVWSSVPKEQRVEEADFFAGYDGQRWRLGRGDTGSLTWCAGATYFTQQPQADGDPARLLRWTDDGRLEIVYETPGSPGFVSNPRCGGDQITISARSEGGDEQVTASLG